MLKLGTVIIVMEFAVKSEWLIQHIEFMINPIEIFLLFENLASGSQQRYIVYIMYLINVLMNGFVHINPTKVAKSLLYG